MSSRRETIADQRGLSYRDAQPLIAARMGRWKWSSAGAGRNFGSASLTSASQW
jgi:hypothetical protein